MTGGIFISYRRDDSAGYAGRLYDRLAARFGSDRVFMDVEGIEPGTDFVVAIEKAVSSCAVLIVLIGDEWLSITDASGRPRLDDPHDFIRLETATALKRDIRVVPVLLEGTPMPPSDSLPEELRMLTRRQAVEVSHKQWESSSGELIRTLERILEQADSSDAGVPAVNVEAPAAASDTAGVPAGTAGPATARPTNAGAGDDTRPSSPGKLLGAVLLATAVGGLGWFFGIRPEDTPTPSPPPPVQTPSAVPPPVVVDQAPGGQPKLIALQPKVDFGSITVETRGAGTARFGNEGTAEARVIAPRLDGADAGSFRIIVNTCEGSLAPGRTCEVNLGFRPLSSGARSANLVVGLADGSQQLSVALAGTGSPPPSSAAPATPSAPVAPVAAPKPSAPRITALSAKAEDGGARICYRASAAQQVELLPSPGVLDKATADCVRVAIDGPTRFTLVVTNPSGSSRKTVLASPRPVVAATPPDTPPAISAQPTGTNTRLPVVGEQWQYRSKGKWPTSPKRRFEVTARSVSGETVQDLLVQIEPPPRFRGETNGTTGAGFVSWNEIGTEFSPYLGVFVTLSEGRSWRNVPTPDVGAYWTQWYTEAKVLGVETVSVPAGHFTATKVVVWSSRRATGSTAEAQLEPVRIRHLVWYAREAKRYVRMERKVISANGSEIENDTFELVSHGGG